MPSSLPALAAGILQSHEAWRVRSCGRRFETTPLVPAYQVDEGLAIDEQPRPAAQAVWELVQKLERLEAAHSSWPVFEAGPYFDLHNSHQVDFCRVEETTRTVRVRLYADLLLPAFRVAERYWAESFLPAYHAGQGAPAGDAFGTHYTDEAVPTMTALFQAAEVTVQATLDLLSDNLDVLTFLGGLEERIQHRPPPGTGLAPGLPPALQRLPREMPTLTLDVLFDRQPFELPVNPLGLAQLTS